MICQIISNYNVDLNTGHSNFISIWISDKCFQFSISGPNTKPFILILNKSVIRIPAVFVNLVLKPGQNFVPFKCSRFLEVLKIIYFHLIVAHWYGGAVSLFSQSCPTRKCKFPFLQNTTNCSATRELELAIK